MTNIVDMNALQPEYKRKLEYYDGDNADIMRVLERNFIAARNAVAKNGWYKQFEGRNLDETCRNVWEFIKTNIPYQEDGIQEQKIVMPPRAIANAKEGIGTDCKSMALMACAIISHYAPVGFRYTSYRANPTPTHVYCVVDGGRYIVDAVWKKYNSEKPYKYKYDKLMKISTLSGIDNTPKLKIDADKYKMIVAYDNLRKQFAPGTERRKLFDLIWSANLKSAIDEAKNDGMNGIDELSTEVDKIFNANKTIGAIFSRPDWATKRDEESHYLLKLNPLFVSARTAFHALANFNAFGIIDRLFKEEDKKPKSISRWWYRMGGNPDELWRFLTKYKSRKPFFGVVQKMRDLLNKILSKAGIHGIYDESINEFGIGVAGVDDVAVAGGGFSAVMGTITASIPVIIPLITAIGNIFDKTKTIPGEPAPGVIPEPPTTGGIDKNLLIYGAIGVGAVILLPKLLKTNK